MTPVDRLVTRRARISRSEDAERLLFERRVEKLPLVDERRQASAG